ncbi:MAG TPA: GNAT family N-acetyltransferase [Caulobacteraceae bacterium]
MNFRIRDIKLPSDETVALSFIEGSQHFERVFEPDRRVDSTVAAEHYAVLMAQVAKGGGCVFIADQDGRAIGWAVFVVGKSPLFVIEEQRAFGHIAELFVEEPARGLGVGRALIAACEDEARGIGLGHVMIGVLTANRRAADIYARSGYAPYTAELRKYL